MDKKKLVLGLTGNPTKTQLHVVLKDYINWLDKENISYLVSTDFIEFSELSSHEKIPPEEIAEQADIVLSFGGDGTLLNAVRLLQGREIPIVGVNVGGLGYLTTVGPEELKGRTLDILQDKWNIERRMILETHIEGKNSEKPWYALNDIVVEKGGYSRLIELNSTIDGEFLNNYYADGIIISTPTGSTGYNLSAGGPIMEPKMAGILFHPLNPHSLSNRPLIIADDKTIRITAHTEYEHVVINVDGLVAWNLRSGNTLVVKRAQFDALLVNFEGKYFYQVLRQKLKWGD